MLVSTGYRFRLEPVYQRVFILLTALALVSGCSRQDFGRPVGNVLMEGMRPGRPAASPLDTEAAEREAAARLARMERVQSAWESEHPVARRLYRVGPEDTLDFAVKSLEEPGELSRLERVVARDGTVHLPLVDAVPVEGLTPAEVERLVAARYEGRFLKDPEVVVRVKAFRSAPVVVTGEVKRPGVYYLEHERGTLLEVISQAGGLGEHAGNRVLLVRGGNAEAAPSPGAPPAPAIDDPLAEAAERSATAAEESVLQVDLSRLVDGGDLRLNLWVRKGDVVNVLPKRRGFVYVLGYVQRPGAYAVEQDAPVSLLQAVALAGGLMATGRAENSLLIRQTDEGVQVVPIDLTRSRAGQPMPSVQDGDTLVVGSSTIARLSEFVRPSVGAGVSYAPVP